MNRIGMSLPWDYLSENYITKESPIVREVLGPPSEGLKRLKSFGVSSIELRHLPPSLSEKDMHKAIVQLLEPDFNISIHSEDPPDSDNWDITVLFPWRKILEEFGPSIQSDITLTLHPVTGTGKSSVGKLKADTIHLFSELSEIQGSWIQQFHFALENQRVKGLVDPGTSFDAIHDMWKKVDSSVVGICWDMGHGYANHLKNGHPETPSEGFINAVTHTHIHDLGPSGATHWPFVENKVPLEKFIPLLKKNGYKGIYNLELGFDRFAGIPDKLGAVENSVNLLKGLVL